MKLEIALTLAMIVIGCAWYRLKRQPDKALDVYLARQRYVRENTAREILQEPEQHQTFQQWWEEWHDREGR